MLDLTINFIIGILIIKTNNMKNTSNIYAFLCMLVAIVVYTVGHTLDAIYIMTFAIYNKQNNI